MRVACKRIHPNARLPERMTEGAAGFDLYACLEESVTLQPGRWALIPTGLQMAIPEGHEGQIRARSGLAFRHGVGVLNGPGTIDCDYRGEIGVLLMNWGLEPFVIRQGERIAQIVFQQVIPVQVEWSEDLDETDRGGGGFGHTGTGERKSP